MAGRGQSPKPLELRLLEGNKEKQALPKNPPKPKRILPTVPEWLDDVARAEFKRTSRILFDVGLLTEADGDALATYCHAFSMLQRCAIVLKESGDTTIDSRGNIVVRPEVRMMAQAWPVIRTFCQEFGMTPSSRGRMHMQVNGEDLDPIEEFL